MSAIITVLLRKWCHSNKTILGARWTLSLWRENSRYEEIASLSPYVYTQTVLLCVKMYKDQLQLSYYLLGPYAWYTCANG